ncbi:uncharacterized protein GLRG_09946 [Colletotrichum graminicola M1.001]|uniref:Uncharacterized protein n=1 Tax=Colletotrichum graminicola (strain M1.001 / M2 / FGSC 10212) TaxID=645133 RepID=E3QVB4_COLGM|nr:uncharacterized protein GLRG_09946 [Colletotrichum graminicola M1.001]EFQ34802.1 hypothetical protein GLRG_09946 [Colletotrichum graminicola M1.001]
MTFGDQAVYMFLISASVILVSIIFTFWMYPRRVLWSAYKYSETWILVKFGIFDVFLRLTGGKLLKDSKNLLKNLEESVARIESRRRTGAFQKKRGIDWLD